MKKFQLSHIAKSLSSGYSFRSKVEDVPDGDIAVIQMKDLDAETLKLDSKLDNILSDGVNPKYLLKAGDVLFLSKGARNAAIVYHGQFQKAIASSSFFIIRVNETVIVPSYLAWYLNSIKAEKHFVEQRVGTYTHNVNRQTLESLELEVPEIKKQKVIAKLNLLSLREYLITREIAEKRKLAIAQELLNSVNK